MCDSVTMSKSNAIMVGSDFYSYKELKQLIVDFPIQVNGWICDVNKTHMYLYYEKAFGLQFHVEQTNETVPQWACVPEYKSALENTLGQNALEKFKKDVEENLNTFNNSARIIYKNFKKII